QLNFPHGLFIDDNQTVVIADHWNNRIMQWKNGNTTNGQVVAGGNGRGNGLNQLYWPIDVLIDKETDSLIICDESNHRVVRWSRRSDTTQGEILINDINCYGLAMDEQRYLYISDDEKHEVRRYQSVEKIGTLVAGGNGQGGGLNQLNVPTYLFVDRQQNVYVSDRNNHRVMKWNKGAKEDEGNNRVMRWTQGAKQGTVIVGGNGKGAGANQFNIPYGLSFDRHGNLYVADMSNNRVQRFSIE
ncbi:unnamed protein product, partial [Rotaria magnacalcarata]